MLANVLSKNTEETDRISKALSGSIKFYQEKIAEQKKLRDSTATTTEEIEDFNKEIAKLQERLDLLQNPDSLKLEVKTQGIADNGGFVLPDPEDVENGLVEKVKEQQKDIVDSTKLTAQELESIYGGVFDTFSQFYGIDTELFKSLLTGKELDFNETADQIASTAKSLANALTESAVIGIENEIQANRTKLDTILNDENASDEAKRIAQEKFDDEERRLNVERARAERTAALVGIAIDTASAIVKSVAASPATFGLPFSAFAAATGAAQAAFVASQPLPQFYKGTENAPEGLAQTDERGAELHLDRFGRIKDFGSDKGARMKFLEKGDIIKTAAQTKNLLSSPFKESPKTLRDLQIIQVNTDEKAMEKAMSRAIKKSRFNVNTSVNLPKKVSWK